MTVIHEFGHRYHTRFLTGDKRGGVHTALDRG